MGIKLVNWNPIAIAGIRSLVAFFVLIVVTRRLKLPKTGAGWLAAVSYSLTMVTFVLANKLTTSANAIFLQYLSPPFVALFAMILLREVPSRLDWVVLCGVLGSMTLFFIERLDTGRLLGNIVAIISGIFFALFVVFMRKASAEKNNRMPIDNMIFGHLLLALLSIPSLAVSPPPDIQAIIGVAYLGTVQIGLSSLFFAYGVSRMNAFGTSLITVIEPVLNPLWVYLVLGETPSLIAAIGGGLIILLITVRSVMAIRR